MTISFKSYLQLVEQLILEGEHDPSKGHVIHLVGGPGSGKSSATKGPLEALGFKTVNSDEAFEHGMKSAGMETTPENIYSEKGQSIRNRAKELTSKRQDLYLKSPVGVVDDGTGRDAAGLIKRSQEHRDAGRQTHMIYIRTSLENALARNRQRKRRLPDSAVEEMHRQAEANIEAYRKHFGDNFHVVDNDDDVEEARSKVYKIGKRITDRAKVRRTQRPTSE
jgi:dephospho-CoA kinase